MIASDGTVLPASNLLWRIEINLQINGPSGTFWLDYSLYTNGLALSEAACYRHDWSGGRFKAIFYYSDIWQNNDLFTHAIGYNQMPIFNVDHLRREANDHNRTPEERAKPVALPTKIRHREGLGNGLSDYGLLAAGIRQSSQRVTAPKSSDAVFDKKCIHSRGVLHQSKRHVMTCAIV